MADSSYMMGDHDNAVAVPFSDDEAANDTKGEELLDEDSPNASPEERVSTQKRRQDRLKRLLSEGKQNKEEVERLKAESAATRGELERLKGYVAAQPQQRPHNDAGKDPYEARLDQVYERQTEAYNAAQAEVKAGTFTPERAKHYEKVAREIETAKSSIHTERAIEARTAQSRTEQAQQVWVQKYPEVYNNPRAFQYAQATWQRRLALGENPTNDVVDEIMADAMTTFRLGKKAPPTASERSRMSGIPSAGSGGSAPSRGIVMSDPKLRRMAVAAYSHLPEEEAVKAWVNKTGKRLRDKKIL